MQSALRALMEHFHALIGYTQSDEMIIFIPPANVVRDEQQPHLRSGRVTKLTTLAASYVTAHVIMQLGRHCERHGTGLDDLAEILPHFDCRLGHYKSWEEAQGLLYWQAYDCSVNGVSDAVYQVKGSGKAIMSSNTIEKVTWLWKQGLLPLPRHQAYGTVLVRVKRAIDGHNPISGTTQTSLRSVIEHVDGPVVELARTGSLFPKGDELEVAAVQQAYPPPCSARWAKYGSIENSINAKILTSIRSAVAANYGAEFEWIASEKIHGANFSFVTNGVDIDYGSRTSRLGNDAEFYNARETMPKYHPFILQAFSLAKQRHADLSCVQIYGEYFGGYYPDLPAEPGMKKVQQGVAYSPFHHFYAFDVCLDGKVFLDFDEARDILLTAGFPLVAEPLLRGTLDDMLAIDVETLETTLPDKLGHPRMDRFRIAEGVVIRPSKEVVFGCNRAILKKKSKAFWEATNQSGMAVKTAAAEGISLGLDHLLVVVRDLANDNRLRAVISKDPELLNDGQKHKLAGLFAKDITEDLQKSNGGELIALGKDAAAALKKSINFITRQFVEEHIVAIRGDVG
jgi:Rnl2 family RNA ligase